MIPRLALTVGEPAGIGPDVLLRALQQHDLAATAAEWVIIGCQQTLTARAEQLQIPLQLSPYSMATAERTAHLPGHAFIIDIPCQQPVQPGQLNPANSASVMAMLERAADGAQRSEFDAIVTAPVHKGVINDAGFSFSGHTELFQARAKVAEVVMMLATDNLRVALVTTHLPLQQVPAAITPTKLRSILDILVADLDRKFGLSAPRILVCGLNPHAGEQGHLGEEEIMVITPVLEAFNAQFSAQPAAQRPTLIGPLPADTLFTPKYLAHADAVLAMYHDQGLPVLKYQGFGRAMNITLGLPYIRTSVDHGTALDMAGNAGVDAGSMQVAIAEALRLATRRTAQ